MSVPGAYTTHFSDDDLDESYHLAPSAASGAGDSEVDDDAGEQAERDQHEIDTFLDAIDDDDDEEEDLDYLPDADQWGANAGDSDEEVMIETDDIEEEEDGEEGEEAEEETPMLGQRTLQIAYDARTGRVLLVNASGMATVLTAQHLRGTGLTLASIRARIAAQTGGAAGGDEEEEEDDDFVDDDDDDDDGSYWGPTRRNAKRYHPVIESPVKEGVELLRGGDFGQPPRKYRALGRKFRQPFSTNVAEILDARSKTYGRTHKLDLGERQIPTSSGVEVAQYQSKVYNGSYSSDGSFFYAAAQDFRVYIYDTSVPPQVGHKSVTDSTAPSTRLSRSYWSHRSSLRTSKIIQANEANCSWTMTDCELSADNQWMIYSSITPRVGLVKKSDGGEWASTEDQQVLDFSRGTRNSSWGRMGIWSIRFNTDNTEIVAGATGGSVLVYDIEQDKTVLKVEGHGEDVNAVCFADQASPNVLLSGSDDGFVKVWDRRSLSGQRASGTLVGHTEGITYIDPKGDGRYVISNGKDQALKLWDLRLMTSPETFESKRIDRINYSANNFDYRGGVYPKPRYLKHPHDNSVMSFHGHSVLRTLIRCHFSPVATTGQQYVYSGSSDGKVHIWSLDGQIVSKLDRTYTHPLIDKETGDYNDPSDFALRTQNSQRTGRYASTVRDVSWHPYQPNIMSTAWEARAGVEGTVARHEWAPKAGEALEDALERQRCEARK